MSEAVLEVDAVADDDGGILDGEGSNTLVITLVLGGEDRDVVVPSPNCTRTYTVSHYKT